MADNHANSSDKDNLIDMAAQRQRLQQKATLLRGKKLSKKTAGKGPRNASTIRWYHYLQLLAFLALVAWLLRTCGN